MTFSGTRRDGDVVASPSAAPLRPTVRGRSVPLLPRTLGVALAVGFAAFLAGAQLAPRMTGPVVIAPPTSSPTATAMPTPTDMPDRSRFATAFDPGALTRSAGMGCDGMSNGASQAGSAYVVYSGTCPMEWSQQQVAVRGLEAAISKSIRDTAQTGSHGFSGPDNWPDAMVMSWHYVSNGFDGMVYLVASSTGSGIHVAMFLTERLPARS